MIQEIEDSDSDGSDGSSSLFLRLELTFTLAFAYIRGGDACCMPDGIMLEFQVVLLAACRTSSEDLNFLET